MEIHCIGDWNLESSGWKKPIKLCGCFKSRLPYRYSCDLPWMKRVWVRPLKTLRELLLPPNWVLITPETLGFTFGRNALRKQTWTYVDLYFDSLVIKKHSSRKNDTWKQLECCEVWQAAEGMLAAGRFSIGVPSFSASSFETSLKQPGSFRLWTKFV